MKYIREDENTRGDFRIGSYMISISYRGRGFTGILKLDLISFFPITSSQMKRLIKICQIAEFPEEHYIREFLGALEYLHVHSYSTPAKKRLRSNMKLCNDRLNFLGYKTIDIDEIDKEMIL